MRVCNCTSNRLPSKYSSGSPPPPYVLGWGASRVVTATLSTPSCIPSCLKNHRIRVAPLFSRLDWIDHFKVDWIVHFISRAQFNAESSTPITSQLCLRKACRSTFRFGGRCFSISSMDFISNLRIAAAAKAVAELPHSKLLAVAPALSWRTWRFAFVHAFEHGTEHVLVA